MVNIRNQTKIKRVLIRDLHICRACGMKASEVHHILPLIYGGRDEEDNMISLCSECHRKAPNDPAEFEKYINQGGSVLPAVYGRTLIDFEDRGISPQFAIPKIKETIRSILYLDTKWALEDYKTLLKESIKIPDVNFRILRKEFLGVKHKQNKSKAREKSND